MLVVLMLKYFILYFCIDAKTFYTVLLNFFFDPVNNCSLLYMCVFKDLLINSRETGKNSLVQCSKL